MLPSLCKIFMSALKLSGAEIRQAFLDFYSQRGGTGIRKRSGLERVFRR
jgi:alanyl-tRNA synthetase